MVARRSKDTKMLFDQLRMCDGLDIDYNPCLIIQGTSNPRDAQAIAFKCQLDGKWKTIGYVVSELLDEVHNVMDNGRII